MYEKKKTKQNKTKTPHLLNTHYILQQVNSYSNANDGNPKIYTAYEYMKKQKQTKNTAYLNCIFVNWNGAVLII